MQTKGTRSLIRSLTSISPLAIALLVVVAFEHGIERVAGLVNQQVGEVVFLFGEVQAQTRSARGNEKREKREKERNIPNMTQQTYDRLAEVEEFVKEKNYQEAIDILDRMLSRGTRRYNGNELAQIHRMFAYVYFEMDNTPKAIEHNERILDHREDIREGQELTTIYTLSQLYFSVENFSKSLEYLSEWFVLEDDPSPQAYNYFATVQYYLKDYAGAAESMETAIQLATDKGYLPIKEGWWELTKFLHHEQENFPRVLEILTILVRDYPKRKAWVELASTYNQLGEPDKAMYSYECAHALGYFDRELDYRQLSAFLMNAEVYSRAAWISQEAFDKGIAEESFKNFNSLGQSYEAAFETDLAIAQYEKAADLAEDGKVDQRLARLYSDRDEFGLCISHADDAIEKGVRRTYNVRLTKGMCEFWDHSLTAARRTFVEARREARNARDASAEKSASDWIRFVDSEDKRLKEIAKADSSG